MTVRRTVRSGLLFIGAIAAAAAAQDQLRPTFKTEANYVRVDVYPTKDGAPVTDLTANDFEIIEDRTPQTLDAFEHIVVRAPAAQDARREPNTVRESRAMLEDPNARAFVLFLDFNHVEVQGSHDIRKPLVDALDTMIGEHDLVAVMTPEMSAGDISFARKTTTIDGFLTKYWTWGEREQINSRDPVEDRYRSCFPGRGPTPACADDDRGVFAAMIARRREKQTLDALEDLVVFLRGVRQERKAVVAVSDGWLLYRPDPSLARRLYCHVPGIDPIGVDPRSGRISTKGPPDPSGANTPDCERDRQQLAAIDDNQEFKRILDEANRSNTSFYPIDPRGLAVFDTPMVPVNGDSIYRPAALVAPVVDQNMLATRLTSIRTLAEATDGLAIVNNNNLAAGLKRVVDDLSSYYLLGYYSSGKLDGKFHAITVRVKRPGVQVRARRGYLAATPDAAKSSASPPDAASLAAAAEAETFARAIAPLASYSREVPLRVQAAAGYGGDGRAAFWVVGELAPGQMVTSSADVDITVSQPGGGSTEVAGHARIEPGARMFRTTVSAPGLEPEDYVLRVRVHGGIAGLSTDLVRLTLPAAPDSAGALVFRRSVATGNRDVSTADLRFQRGDTLRADVPAPGASTAQARLLDRTGHALDAIPVKASVRTDADAMRWASASLAVAPLAAGDYLIELTWNAPGVPGGVTASRETTIRLVAFRVVR